MAVVVYWLVNMEIIFILLMILLVNSSNQKNLGWGKENSFPGGSVAKNPPASVIPGSGISPGEGNGNPLQYSCLEKPMDGGVW